MRIGVMNPRSLELSAWNSYFQNIVVAPILNFHQIGFSSYMFCLHEQAYECMFNEGSKFSDGGTDTQLPEWL
jgi:hypothetical protein